MRRDGSWWLPLAVLVLAIIAGIGVWRRWTRQEPAPEAATAVAEPPVEAPASDDAAQQAEAEGEHTAPGDPLAGLNDPTTPWSKVDLKALEAEMPNNLYWKMAVPTTDPEVLRWREEERDRWNVEYGKVLSNTATPDEIDGYYAYRYRLSSDYVQFATYLLADYGEDLPARDVALLKMAIEMHMARLEEIPRQTTEAHERAAAHDAARRAWLEEQKAFTPPTR